MTLLHAVVLVKHYGGVSALGVVDLPLHAGERLGLLVANGSGKSTLTSIVSGENRPDEGAVEVDGAALRLGHPEHARGLGVVVAHQHPELAPDLPVWENVFLGPESTMRFGLLNKALSRSGAFSILNKSKPDCKSGRASCRKRVCQYL